MSALTKHFQIHTMPLRPSQYSLLSSKQGARAVSARSASENGASAVAEAGSSFGQAVMTDTGRILDTELPDELQKSYLSYAMSVIVGRALPDVRDGLKPVHRRILFAMHELGLHPNKQFRKSARVVGEVLGKYHPHGDTAVYDALVRLAQPFTMRLPLVNGHGNFGSQDNDPAAAMRYTECRLQQASSSAFLQDLQYDTVDYLDTFDGSQQEPSVLPARIPHLLVNGSQGIAVGMATHIPPHNMGEVVAGLEALIEKPDITNAELLHYMPGPDFPTGGEIMAAEGSLESAYTTGRGSVLMSGKAFIEDEESQSKKGGKQSSKSSGSGKSIIVITELPYQTNKAKMVEEIASLAGTSLQGVTDVRDESDRDGMRVVVEMKRGTDPVTVLNGLYHNTRLRSRFACNFVALVNGTPLTLALKDFLSHFLDFRCDVVRRRARHILGGAEKRLHIVEGLAVAHGNMDRVVDTIRSASDSSAAAGKLSNNFGLSAEQAAAVLDMTLRRLTALEIGKVEEESRTLQQRISELKELLGSESAIRGTVAREAREVADALSNPRRTAIVNGGDGKLSQEDLIPNRLSLIVFSSRGYIKRMTPDHFSVQGRGGKGMRGAGLREDDSIEEVQQVMDHDNLMFFTSDGKMYVLKAYQIPEASRTAQGSSFSSLLKIDRDQKVAAMIAVRDSEDDRPLLLLTKNGWLKQVTMFSLRHSFRRPGLSAIKLNEGDELTWVQRCQPGEDVILGHRDGTVARYNVDMFRPMSKTAKGLQASKLQPGNRIMGMSTLKQVESQALTPKLADGELEEGGTSEEDVSSEDESEEEEIAGPSEGPYILFVTEQGHGKLTPVSSFRPYAGRRGRGVRGVTLPEGSALAAFNMVADTENTDVLISTNKGIVTRISLGNVPISGRTARGSILMRLKDDEDRVSAVTLLSANADG